ncbi:hypothetical protein H5410_059457 [Solanum commersonii]|uniref:Uncharacterized protein n=1 Tax=Solanum commersonii TaxID=4109 RepID=A0A9J5W2F2_SOLCO|nr:hypothetical protein H5410_059457 [Solanum commersonii]
MREARLRWFGHIQSRSVNTLVGMCKRLVIGVPRGVETLHYFSYERLCFLHYFLLLLLGFNALEPKVFRK